MQIFESLTIEDFVLPINPKLLVIIKKGGRRHHRHRHWGGWGGGVWGGMGGYGNWRK